ncbi:MAG: methylated-DNA--[protein]-cysteine S-methyltransferase [Rhizobacter sp.]|nr:methylated-DNA--[protein]-cysteine S-methyltransferase [Chlorobiales bacterium]
MTQQTLDYERVQKAIEFLSHHFKSQPNLDEVAEAAHLSPYHFQRLFTAWAGVSPKRFLQFLTLDFLRTKLHETQSIAEAAELAGLSAQSRVYDLFVGIEGVTPQEYKSGGRGLDIDYGFHPTPFGECFIAAAEKGVCALAFVSEATAESEVLAFSQKWNFAKVHRNQHRTEKYVRQIFGGAAAGKINVLVQGTNFQLKVWEALLKIPSGAVSTYEQIAKSTGNAKAVRAVGSAVAANPVGYLIPCHRVIRKEGKIGQYHWGETRKQAMIGWEMSQHEPSAA